MNNLDGITKIKRRNNVI